MAQRKRNHSLELVWRGSQAYGSESDLFTSQYPTGNYGACPARTGDLGRAIQS
jgi:hypothetical protein